MKTETRRWLELAQENRRMAGVAFEAALFRPCVFHCQQSIEKLLKAIWTEQADFGVAPKTHGLVSLAQETRLELEDEVWELLDALTKQYNPTRYGDVMAEYTREQAQRYYERTVEFYEWLLGKLS